MVSVLLVDDGTAALGSLALLVAAHGHLVNTAINGMDALRRVRTNRPDVVVADCDMPVMDGVDLAREMQADPELARVPVVLLLAGAGRPRVRVFAVLRKPFAPTKLLELIKRIDRRNPKLLRSIRNRTRDAMLSARMRVSRRRKGYHEMDGYREF
ncbi:two-component system chemotaxis response regulator CheY [Paraburkholderia sp. BL8N3]|nr:response regulator [Paraburkholderia sp. BL8N3]TCK33620.1 two-component system chemotaxis response regulator CheY [Paraburkholderia sp. BL8N3]